MKRRKNIVHLMLLLLFVLGICCFGGCGTSEKEEETKDVQKVQESPKDKNISKGQFLELLCQEFGFEDYEANEDLVRDVSSSNPYYDVVQACAEWNVIDINEDLKLDEEASIEFALACAVRAIGEDWISETGADFGSGNYTKFYLENIAKIDASDLSAGMSEKTGKAILEYAVSYYGDMELPQVVNIKLAEGVKEAYPGIDLPEYGNTGFLIDNTQYQEGDIVYWDETEWGMPRGVRIQKIENNSFTFEDVSVEEIYSQMEFSGTFDGEIVNVYTASDNITFSQDELDFPDPLSKRFGDSSSYLMPLKGGIKKDVAKDHVVFTVNTDNAELKIGIENIKLTGKYEHGSWGILDPKEVRMTAKFDTFARFHAEKQGGKTIPLGDVDIKICGPFFARVSLTANVAYDGNVDIDYTIKHTASIGWKKGNGISKSYKTDLKNSIEGEVTVVTEVTPMADLRVKVFGGSKSVTNIQATTGVVIIAKADGDILGDEKLCKDVFGYVPLRWGVNQKGCLLTKLNGKWKYSQVVWDSKNAKFKFHFHYEDGQRTEGDKCTKPEDKKVEQKEEQDNGNPLDEYILFKFEPLKFELIRVKNYALFLEKDVQAEIGFESLPEGYSMDNLKYIVSNPEICTVDKGKVNAKSAGSTLIRIESEDGMYSAVVAVIVTDSYDSAIDFQEL